MRTPIKVAFIGSLALTLAGFTSSAQPPPQGEPGFRGPRFGASPHHRRGLAQDVLEKYDSNQDGKLDEQERAALHQDVDTAKLERPDFRNDRRRPGGRPLGPPKELLEQYDANKDGHLDETEHAAVKQDIDAGKLQAPRGEGGFRPPTPPSPAQILEKHDLDKDGKLDESELDTFLKSHRPPPPGGRRGPGGPGRNEGPGPEQP